MFEISGLDRASAQQAMRLASHKLSVKTKFAARIESGSAE
jgi:ribosomal protein L16/L10AE